MASQSERSILYEGMKVSYDSYGSGSTALVFIHGWTCARSLWYHQAPLFQQHRSLLIDVPGHGKSDAPKIEYSLEKMASAVNRVLAHEGITWTIFIAHSMGGPVSTMALRLNPGIVSAIIYVDSFFYMPEAYLNIAERKELAAAHSDDAKFRAFLDPFQTDTTSAADWTMIVDTMMATPLHVRTNATTTLVQPHAWRYDEVYQIPALLIVTPIFEKIDRHWLHHIPRLETDVWQGHGHFLFMEDPARFNKVVQEFVERHHLL